MMVALKQQNYLLKYSYMCLDQCDVTNQLSL
ncbi:hypothetical protein J551_4467, partial [Acinetobacter sp. 1475718]